MTSPPNAIESALTWIGSIFAGPVSLGIATIAVAAFGFMLLTGRLDARHGVQAIVGCFILFGASAIAAEIMSSVHGNHGEDAPPALYNGPPMIQPTESHPAAADPYAGAAVPRQR